MKKLTADNVRDLLDLPEEERMERAKEITLGDLSPELQAKVREFFLIEFLVCDTAQRVGALKDLSVTIWGAEDVDYKA